MYATRFSTMMIRCLCCLGCYLACGMLITFSSASTAATLDKIRETQTLTIAYRASSIPFSYTDDKGKPMGYAIDLCMKIAQAIKRELHLPRLDIQYLPITPVTRIPAIAEGRADMECGSTTNTQERRLQVAFSIPYFVAYARMLVRDDSTIKNWPDLQGKTIVTTRGTTNAQTLASRDKIRSLHITLLESKDHAEAFAMVKDRRADAFAMDDVLLSGLRAKDSNPEAFRIVGDPLSAEPYALILRKDDAAFKSMVDREIARVMLDREIYPLYDKWFRQAIAPGNINMNMPMGQMLRTIVQFPSDQVPN